jgi:hypothetical protein
MSDFASTGHNERGKRTWPPERLLCVRKRTRWAERGNGDSSPEAVIPRAGGGYHSCCGRFTWLPAKPRVRILNAPSCSPYLGLYSRWRLSGCDILILLLSRCRIRHASTCAQHPRPDCVYRLCRKLASERPFPDSRIGIRPSACRNPVEASIPLIPSGWTAVL